MEQELSRLEKISEQRSLDSLTNQLTIADHLVYKKYLTELQNYGMVALSQQMLKAQEPTECIQMYHLHELTLKKAKTCFRNFLRYTIPVWRRDAVWQ